MHLKNIYTNEFINEKSGLTLGLSSGSKALVLLQSGLVDGGKKPVDSASKVSQ